MNKLSTVLALALTLAFDHQAMAAATSGMPAASDAKGNIHFPTTYRTTFQYLGSWSIAQDKGQGAKQMHMVYASPGAVEAFKKDGHFPDGTVLVKEVFEPATASMTTGTVSHAETLKGWFVMVKDSKNSHPDSKLWGDGWGWSWFDAGNTTSSPTKDYKAECLACHQPASSTDWVYVQGYPVLKK